MAILVAPALKIVNNLISGDGRWAIVAIESILSDKVIVIANVYAPNGHRASTLFFTQFFTELDGFCNDLVQSNLEYELILCGDFNTVLDPSTASLNRTSTSAELNLIRGLQCELADRALVDCVPSNCSYTWRGGICCSRLDYIYASVALQRSLESSCIFWNEYGSRLDHAAVKAIFSITRSPSRGRSFPKLFKSDIHRPADR